CKAHVFKYYIGVMKYELVNRIYGLVKGIWVGSFKTLFLTIIDLGSANFMVIKLANFMSHLLYYFTFPISSFIFLIY
ncbi:MAG: hypothetical protein WKF85_13960, partial [Chitinophagaceae bacterium]